MCAGVPRFYRPAIALALVGLGACLWCALACPSVLETLSRWVIVVLVLTVVAGSWAEARDRTQPHGALREAAPDGAPVPLPLVFGVLVVWWLPTLALASMALLPWTGFPLMGTAASWLGLLSAAMLWVATGRSPRVALVLCAPEHTTRLRRWLAALVMAQALLAPTLTALWLWWLRDLGAW